MSESIRLINISLEIFGALLSLILIICVVISETRNTNLNRLFIGMLLSNFFLTISDAVSWIIMGDQSTFGYYVIYISTIFVFTLGYVGLFFFSKYVTTYISTRVKIPKTSVYVTGAFCLASVILTIISQFNHMYYYFDEYNVYQRQGAFWLSQVMAIASMIASISSTIIYRKYLNRRKFLILLSYMLFPVLAMVIQLTYYGLAVLYIATTISLVAIYTGIQMDQAGLLKQRELELTESRMAVMLSQIQPHFLFNSLVAIKQLYKLDPVVAEQTLIEFSTYLRSNLDSLTIKQPIPFEKELRHVANYLVIEQKRFGDKIKINYDIQTVCFMLPVLTLQPIVENAVRYGVTKRERGGIVTIKTEEKHSDWRITVTDDGVGFDVSEIKQDGRSHIGIANVRSRLQAMCDGKLEIQSRLGIGTIAIITIPKGDKFV